MNQSVHIVLLGAPGAGKGTQAAALAKELLTAVAFGTCLTSSDVEAPMKNSLKATSSMTAGRSAFTQP